jgi:hypothetical protein
MHVCRYRTSTRRGICDLLLTSKPTKSLAETRMRTPRMSTCLLTAAPLPQQRSTGLLALALRLCPGALSPSPAPPSAAQVGTPLDPRRLSLHGAPGRQGTSRGPSRGGRSRGTGANTFTSSARTNTAVEAPLITSTTQRLYGIGRAWLSEDRTGAEPRGSFDCSLSLWRARGPLHRCSVH